MQALTSLNAMDQAHNILESSLGNRLKQSTFFYHRIKIKVDIFPLPQFFMHNNPPSLDLSCLESLAIAYISAYSTPSSSPLWCMGSVIKGSAS